MGEENHDRQERRARVVYIGAKDRFLAALAAFDDSGTPMDPGPDQPYPWTDEQWVTVLALLAARTWPTPGARGTGCGGSGGDGSCQCGAKISSMSPPVLVNVFVAPAVNETPPSE
jgi:hypothetical protein